MFTVVRKSDHIWVLNYESRTCVEDVEASMKIDASVICPTFVDIRQEGLGMKSAFEIGAFSQGSEISGILRLLIVAQEALDRDGRVLAAAHLDRAIIALAESGAVSGFEMLPIQE